MAGRSEHHDEIARCDREAEVLRALAGAQLSHDLLSHTESCPVCSEVLSIGKQLVRLDESSLGEPLQSAASMWWRLNLRMRRQHAIRAQLPLVWMGRICAATLVLIGLSALARTAVSSVLIVGMAALAAVALPAMIVLWRWSRS